MCDAQGNGAEYIRATFDSVNSGENLVWCARGVNYSAFQISHDFSA